METARKKPLIYTARHYQRDLFDTRILELQAQVNYQLAISALQKTMNVIGSANEI
jgi:hypothetical protein